MKILYITLILALSRFLDVFSTHYFNNDFESIETNILISVFKLDSTSFVISQYAVIPFYLFVAYLILRIDLSKRINAYEFTSSREFISLAFRPYNTMQNAIGLFLGSSIKDRKLFNLMIVKCLPIFVILMSMYATINNIVIARFVIPIFSKSNAKELWTIHWIIVMAVLFATSFYYSVRYNINLAKSVRNSALSGQCFSERSDASQ